MSTSTQIRAYVYEMLRRDLYREPTEREVAIWTLAFELNGSLAPEFRCEDEAEFLQESDSSRARRDRPEA